MSAMRLILLPSIENIQNEGSLCRSKRTYITIDKKISNTQSYQASFICCYKQQIKSENDCTNIYI